MDLKLEHFHIEDKESIEKLYQHYLHDLSKHNDSIRPDAAGLFDSSFVDTYYSQENIIPLAIILGHQILGFLICSTGQTVDHVIQDIFILKQYRHRGFGKLAVKLLFDRCPGRFGLVVMVKNKPAMLFWQRTLENTGINYESSDIFVDGISCTKLLFDTTNG